MYACELFETIKEQAIGHKKKVGDKALHNIFSNLFTSLREVESFSQEDACAAVLGAFACVAANDGRISMAEYEHFKNANPTFQQYSYDDFFNIMAKYNKQEHRDRTAAYFNRLQTEEVARKFIGFCVMVAVVDGNVALNEELFCESLCEIYLNRFIK